jgi:ABC-2 type transport system ATP-binding protein
MMSNTVIETENISKDFKTVKALDNISIQVHEGEIYGFLGLNGAGKTTLIRILLGMIKPTKGTIALFGNKIDGNFNQWNSVGYLVETPYSYPNLSVIENLRVYHTLRQLKDKKLIDEIVEKLHLTDYAHTKEEHLSMGNKLRLGLAKALMHKPKLLILDEPVNGLDPEGIVEVRELLKHLSANGTTVFLSSHILGEISKLANRIAIIHKGKLLEEVNSSELNNNLIKKVLVKTNDNGQAIKYLSDAGYNTVGENDEIAITDNIAIEKPENISTLLVEKGLPAKQIYTFTEDLEMYFLRKVEEGKNHE